MVFIAAAPKSKLPARPTSAPSTAEQRIAARWLAGLSLREQVAQLVMIPFSGRPLNPRSREYRAFEDLVANQHVGGLILVNVAHGRIVPKADPLEAASFINKMQRVAKTPLIVGGDFERGASMRIDATTVFPHAMAFAAGRDPSAARFEGVVTAREARALGVHWVYFPDADVNNNPDNPIINIRAFSENPQEVATYVRAFIEGAQSDKKNRVLTTAKHFPGHGDTSTDSHMHMATIASDRKHLSEVEFVPFRAAIEQGVDSIMTAHIAVPAVEAADVPATLSPVLLTDILRKELGFKGIIVTDALEMGGIARGYNVGEAAVRAIEAGVDILLMPPDPVVAINAVTAAVLSGQISRARLEQSVMRVLAAKASVGLDTNSLVDLDKITEVINSPESSAHAQRIAEHAVTLVKNEQDVVPLRAPEKACFLVMTESHTTIQGLAFAQEVRRRAPSAQVLTLDSSLSDAELAQQTGSCEVVVAAAYATVGAYRGDMALGSGFHNLLNNLLAAKKPVILVALGSPYLLRTYPSVQAYLATFSTVPPSEVAAVRALFGETAIQGHLPITIPGFARYGEGIQLGAAQH